MPRALAVIAVLLILIPVVRVVATYDDFGMTYDEAVHIRAGMQALNGKLMTDTEHPPLARLMFILRPALEGEREIDPHALIARNGRRDANLAQVRTGNLPFLVIALAITGWWSWRLFGPFAALAAIALLGTLPPVLGHAGITTTDMSVTAMLPVALFFWSRWLERKTWRSALAAAIAIALACLSKFSFILYFPLAALTFVVARRTFPAVRQLLAAIAVIFVVIWGAYRFDVGTLQKAAASTAGSYSTAPGYEWVSRYHVSLYRLYAEDAAKRGIQGIDFVDWARAAGYPSPLAGRSGRDTMEGAPPPQRVPSYFEDGPFRGLADRFYTSVPVPAPLFWFGLDTVKRHSAQGHDAFLLGEYSKQGWWYYFPVVWFFKTPLPFAILAIAGMVVMMRRGPAEARALAFLPLAILLPAMTGGINIGVRHVLPIYPFLAICAGYAIASAFPRAMWRALAIALAAWLFIGTAKAHPDYLAWFNEAARGRPERIAVDSNLDWGQDIKRLERYLREKKIDDAWLAIFGDKALYHLPGRELPRHTPVEGWIAVSETTYAFGQDDRFEGGLQWLAQHEPVDRVGKSIRIYRIP